MGNMKNVMILGASATQVPLIKCAKRLGYKTYVASIPGDYPGFSIADVAVFENTTNKEAIFEICKREKIDGICTTGTDVAVRSIGFVNSRLGLCGITEESAMIVTDKAKMKQVMWQEGVRTAEFAIAYSLEDACSAAEQIGYPVMVKTVDQAASKGITKVAERSQMAEAYENARYWTKKEYIVVEKYLEGEEIGLDGYVDAEGAVTLFLHNKITYDNGKTHVPIGHSVPFKITDADVLNDISTVAKACVAAMKLRSVFFNMDLMLCGNKAYVIEIGGRTGSTCIPDMLSEFCGFDYYAKILQNSLGYPVDVQYEQQCACAAGFLCANRGGVLKAAEIPCFRQGISYEIDVKPGEPIKKFSLGADRIGQIVCLGENLDMAESLFHKTHSAILEGLKYEK
jgi:biotin carboxylase